MTHKKLIEIIESYGLTKVDIGRALGVSYMTIYRWLKVDKIKPANMYRLKKLHSQLEYNETIPDLKLSKYSTRDLISELKRRGWVVTITAK